jgi:hypothetical protein
MQYRLEIIDSHERTIRELDVKADTDDAAMAHGCVQSIHFDLAVEL